MSGTVLVAALTYAPQIIALIQGLTAAGVDAATAFGTVSTIVQEGRAPTDAEWALADTTADEAHAALQAATT